MPPPPPGLSAPRSTRCGLLARVLGGGLAHPRAVLVRVAAVRMRTRVHRPAAGEHLVELGPVDLARVPALRLVVPAQLGVGQRHAEDLGLRHEHPDEPLAQLVVREALDLPRHGLRRVRRLVIRRAEHHERRPVPAVHGILRHLPLRRRALHERQQDLEALPLVERLLLADAHHRAAVRAVRRAAERHLVADRGAVDEPADRAHVGPRRRRVVEDRRVLRPAVDELLGHLVARDAEGLRGGVQVQPVTGLVLHLRHQDRLALEARRARDPVALGLHADDLGVRVLRDLPDERLAVGRPASSPAARCAARPR